MDHSNNKSILPTGYKLDCYTVQDVLGTGGFGITYKAVDDHLGHNVAIKEFFPSSLAHRTNDLTVAPNDDASANDYGKMLKNFLREGQVLASLDHPNIVRVARYLELNNTAYLIMKYEQGSTLRHLLRHQPFLPYETVVYVLNKLLDALETIHNHNLLHRDIKPSNIYMRQDEEPVLIDFGSARVLTGSRSAALTSIISEGYAPIEQYPGEIQQTPATDLYSLGATLYFMVSGMPPSSALQRFQSIHSGKSDTLVSATIAADPSYDDKLLNLIDWMLSIDLLDRPQSANDVRAFLSGSSLALPRSLPAAEHTTQVQSSATQSRSEAPVNKSRVDKKSLLLVVAGLSVSVLIIATLSLYWFFNRYHGSGLEDPGVEILEPLSNPTGARITLAPYTQEDFNLVEFHKFGSAKQTRVLLYRKRHNDPSGKQGINYEMVGLPHLKVVRDKLSTSVNQPSIRYSSAYIIEKKRYVRLKLTRRGTANDRARLLLRYRRAEGRYNTLKQLESRLKASLKVLNLSCDSKLSVKYDKTRFNSNNKQDVLLLGQILPYLDSIKTLCDSKPSFKTRLSGYESIIAQRHSTKEAPQAVVSGKSLTLPLKPQRENVSLQSYFELRDLFRPE